MKDSISAGAIRELIALSPEKRRELLEGLEGQEPEQEPEQLPEPQQQGQIYDPDANMPLLKIESILSEQKKILAAVGAVANETNDKYSRQKVIVDLLEKERDRLAAELETSGIEY